MTHLENLSATCTREVVLVHLQVGAGLVGEPVSGYWFSIVAHMFTSCEPVHLHW
jgi:hypothetical protein